MPLMLALLLAAQTTPVAPIVKGTGLPPPGTEEGQVMAPVQAVLHAIESADGAAILANSRPEGGLTAAFDGPGGKRMVRRVSWADFAASLKPGGDHYSETISDPAIESDGDVAYVWAPFVVRKNGVIDHCGYDLFDVVREDGTWKVLNVTWSQRITGCAG
jgi:hypothetical protein